MFAACLFFGVILYAIGHATRRQHARTIVTPVTQAESAGPGRVRLYGRALGDPADAAPITSRPSAYWEAELWDTRWVRNRLPAAKEMCHARVIWLEDASGRLPVLLHGVEWMIADEDEFRVGQALPYHGHAFVERHGYRWDSGHVRLKERRIEHGESILVLGVVAPVAEVVSVLDRLEDSPLHRAVQAMSARSAGHATNDSSIGSHLRRLLQPHDRIVWCERQALVISNRAPEATARRMQWTARACTAAAAGFVIVAIASLFLPI